MVKRHLAVMLLIVFMISASGCYKSKEEVEAKVKPVKTVELKETESPVLLKYSGIVSFSRMKKLSFKSGGRIESVEVEEGQYIKTGDTLAVLEDKDLKFALAAAAAQVGAARSMYEKAVNGAAAEDIKNAELNVKKAQDAYDFTNNSFGRIESLYRTGAVSKNDMEKAKLELDIREAELDQAKELLSQVKTGSRSEDKKALARQLDQAKADYDYKASLAADAVMKADVGGYVVEVLYKEGELVPAGYPVVVVRDSGAVVNVGLAEKDCSSVKPGMKANISSGSESVEGTVNTISQVPDSGLGTYVVEIELKDGTLNLGAVVDVDIITGTGKGIWIPLTSMLSDGMDYVFVAKENIAEKREITIEEISGNMARVSGLEQGEQLVIEGMKRLRAGDGVSVIK